MAKIDYTNICSCGHQEYLETLFEAKGAAKHHVKENPGHEVYIDRNKDYEIDDTFKSIIIK